MPRTTQALKMRRTMTGRKRRYGSKRPMPMRITSQIATAKTYRQNYRQSKIVRTQRCGTIDVAAGGADVFGFVDLKPTNIPNWSEITAMYDEYRVDYAVVTFKVIGFSNDGFLYTAMDFNDGATPTKAGLLQYPSVNITQGDYEIRCRPKAAVDVNGTSGVGNFYGNPWCKTSVTDTPYYAIKYGFCTEGAALTTGPRVLITCRYYISVRGGI